MAGIDSTAMFNLGLKAVGFVNVGTSRKNNLVRYMASYGAHPEAMVAIWEALQSTDNPIVNPNLTYFFMAFNWLKTYDTYPSLASRWKMDEKSVSKWVRYYVEAIQGLKGEKIKWEVSKDDIFLLSVDGVHCNIDEPRKKPSTGWKSHKSNGPGLAYELGLLLHHSQLVWINGPFAAGSNDIRNFNEENGLKSKIPPGKKVITDRVYSSEIDVCSIPNDLDTPEVNEFKRRARARHETFNKRIKNFNILSNTFRHGLHLHQMVFEAVCVIMQFEMENGYPLFDI